MKLGEQAASAGDPRDPHRRASLTWPGCGRDSRGRVTELYGHESAGKTTLALHVIAEPKSRAGGGVRGLRAWLDPLYASRIGVKTTTSSSASLTPAAGCSRSSRSWCAQVRRRHRHRLVAAWCQSEIERDGRRPLGAAGSAHVTGAAQAHRRDLRSRTARSSS